MSDIVLHTRWDYFVIASYSGWVATLAVAYICTVPVNNPYLLAMLSVLGLCTLAGFVMQPR